MLEKNLEWDSMTERESLIWASGLFEGEGCFSNTKPDGQVYFLMRVEMTDEDVIRHLHHVMQCGNVTVRNPPSKNSTGRKPTYSWQITGKTAIETAMRLMPFLGYRRREKAAELISKALAAQSLRRKYVRQV